MKKEEEIALGKSFGFTPIEDERRGYGWPRFIKQVTNGALHVWQIRDGWQTSFLRNDNFQDHKKFLTLKEALERKE